MTLKTCWELRNDDATTIKTSILQKMNKDKKQLNLFVSSAKESSRL